MLRPKTLRQRMLLFLLMPVALLMMAMGWFAFNYARDNLLAQWRETAVLELRRAAHQVDMRLREPKFWMRMFGRTGGEPQAGPIQDWIVKQLNDVTGVEAASATRLGGGAAPGPPRGHMMMWMRGRDAAQDGGWDGFMQFDEARIAEVRPPVYDVQAGEKTVSLVSDLLGGDGAKVGELEVAVRLGYLVENAFTYGWPEAETACLLDDHGRVLTCNLVEGKPSPAQDQDVFEAVRDAMTQNPWGTLLNRGKSFNEVVGYCRLGEAPWTLVVTARNRRILAPIYKFTTISLIAGLAFIVLVVVLIRTVAASTVASIVNVSRAAEQVAAGDFSPRLVPGGQDEVGQLIRSFNVMTEHLEERIRLKEGLDLAMQVQQNLLPSGPPRREGLDIAGRCVYCDETGGDYYDFLDFPELGEGNLSIAVGDSTGHGISAALFMTTVRALLRARVLQGGSLGDAMSDVNRLLWYDTARTGDFMTLFFAMFDTAGGGVRWVRAGHPPALIYDWRTDSFEELKGEGIALGMLADYGFEESRYDGWTDTKVLLIGTDGIWEATDPSGEMFGMERLHAVLRRHARNSSQEILDAVLRAVTEFRQTAPQEDDITVVALKSSRAASTPD